MTRLILEYDGNRVDLGYVERFSDTYNKSVSTVPLCSFPSDSTFAIESGSGEDITISIKRRNPEDPNDSSSDMTRWSNAKWYRAVQAVVDRWQARTDGAILDYLPDKDNPYTPARRVNGYIQNLTLTYNSDYNEIIRGSLQFAVGTMFVRNPRAEPISGFKGTQVRRSEYYVAISDSAQASYHLLMSDEYDVDCISSYSLQGGMECPFEVLEMTLIKDRLTAAAPSLVNDIVAGKNKVVVHAVGICMAMTVSDASLSGNRYRITAYADSARICSALISEGATMSAKDWIKEILCTGNYGVSYVLGETLYLTYKDAGRAEDLIEFEAGAGAWRALQICAMYMGCKVFFCEGKAYVVDCRYHEEEYAAMHGGYPISDYDPIDLYARGKSDPYYARVTGNISLGAEGISTIVNSMKLTCRTAFGSDQVGNITKKDPESVDAFGESSAEVLDIRELVQNSSGETGTDQGVVFADNFMSYRREPQQSITFTLKEVVKEGSSLVWQSAFAPISRAEGVSSAPDGYAVSNQSVLRDGVSVPQKLMMSTFTRNYPEGTTTYSFGVITPVDLSSATGTLGKNVG